jgi:hypothetical protein
MKVLTAMPARQGGRTEQYPWTEWFDGAPRLLESGIDFDTTTEGIRASAYAAAKRHGVKVRVATIGTDIAVQASRPEGD